MKPLSKFDNIFIHKNPVDFRRGIFSLTTIIQDELELNPFDNTLFLFTNSRQNRLRMIYWDKTGFALWYKILEKGKFFWPHAEENECVVVDRKSLQDLLKGMNPWQQGHSELKYKFL